MMQLQDTDDAELPLSSLQSLRPEAIDLARRLNPLLGHLADEKGNADIVLEIRRGEATAYNVSRRFKLS
ncbi:hypothetical protein [Tengunoibacter tsumagoiensis]|uniref:Uncharacterized protein n=1 Tax=Tengunoibacter tsumagoiensis TaxID=2014871 RepID=A0A402A508_9CHLR|nr:hypothetical protein [Tengunoibacter tsumagoiensis]GCE14179.1 hypothetical protein KTT_40380 [Tengunoibacter tsumagoiensis]GCE14233.1 hypothetical protein KTT_40920 [Tengunoibacter tsumagoiensis]